MLRCSGTAVPEALRRQLQECLQAKGCMLLELHLDGCKGGLADLEGGEGEEGGSTQGQPAGAVPKWTGERMGRGEDEGERRSARGPRPGSPWAGKR